MAIVQTNGSTNKDDPYHNEYLDTGGMLAQSLKGKFSGANIDISGNNSEGDPAAIEFGAKVPARMSATGASEESGFSFSTNKMETIASSLGELKNSLSRIFQKNSKFGRASG